MILIIRLVQKISRFLYCKFQEDLILFLKRKAITLPIPKNPYPSKLCINSEITIFAASKWEIVYIEKNNNRYEKETDCGCVWPSGPVLILTVSIIE